MAIVAVGTDIVSIDRIQAVCTKHPERFIQKHFCAIEADYCLKHHKPYASLAARFAAKEAFQKCWPQSIAWTDVWVEHSNKRPVLCFAPWLAERMQALGYSAHLSLSHEKHHAIAFVVLET